jgi:hypothetical protein
MPESPQCLSPSSPINQGQLASYFVECRARIPLFINNYFSLQGAYRLNRFAMGRDIFIAPFNFLMGLPNFLLRLIALLLEWLGAHRQAQRLLRIHFGFPTRVQQTLTTHLLHELLNLPRNPETGGKGFQQLLYQAAKEPVQIYVQTRNVAADITAGTLAAFLGLILLNQFTPGSISAGAAVAHLVATEQAASGFFLGETLGRFYYTLFPVSPPIGIVLSTMLVVMVTIALVAAFSGMIHDPIQRITGIHHRRLTLLLDAIEKSARQSLTKGYRPKDTFFGRVYDLIDWIKGLISF